MAHARSVPDAVRQKALALGGEGERWLRELPSSIAALEAEWAIDVGDAIAGGSGAYVAPARTLAGATTILKVSMPDGLVGNSPFACELDTLRLGDGPPYVRLLHADVHRRAMLLERLGRPLASLGMTVEAQIDVIAQTLSRGWRRIGGDPPLRTGAAQAEFLAAFVEKVWNQLSRPCAADTIRRAVQYARSRRDAFDETRAVLIHGDAHPANVLEHRYGSGEFRLIDPDGMMSESAHDLAIPLRDWTTELLAGDPAALGRVWCARLSELADVDPIALWEWAFLERVSTGLFLLQLGDPHGQLFLDVAESWTALP